jgi:hypothetical protein
VDFWNQKRAVQNRSIKKRKAERKAMRQGKKDAKLAAKNKAREESE